MDGWVSKFRFRGSWGLFTSIPPSGLLLKQAEGGERGARGIFKIVDVLVIIRKATFVFPAHTCYMGRDECELGLEWE